MTNIKNLENCVFELRGYCPVSLYLGNTEIGQPHIALVFDNKYYSFASVKNMRVFFKNPVIFKSVTIPKKLEIKLNKQAPNESREKGDLESLLQNELSRLVVRCLNQLSWSRIKYPGLSEKSTALKLMALCLKSSNIRRDQEYRNKYKHKLKEFITDCLLPKQIQEEKLRRGKTKI